MFKFKVWSIFFTVLSLSLSFPHAMYGVYPWEWGQDRFNSLLAGGICFLIQRQFGISGQGTKPPRYASHEDQSAAGIDEVSHDDRERCVQEHLEKNLYPLERSITARRFEKAWKDYVILRGCPSLKGRLQERVCCAFDDVKDLRVTEDELEHLEKFKKDLEKDGSKIAPILSADTEGYCDASDKVYDEMVPDLEGELKRSIKAGNINSAWHVYDTLKACPSVDQLDLLIKTFYLLKGLGNVGVADDQRRHCECFSHEFNKFGIKKLPHVLEADSEGDIFYDLEEDGNVGEEAYDGLSTLFNNNNQQEGNISEDDNQQHAEINGSNEKTPSFWKKYKSSVSLEPEMRILGMHRSRLHDNRSELPADSKPSLGVDRQRVEINGGNEGMPSIWERYKSSVSLNPERRILGMHRSPALKDRDWLNGLFKALHGDGNKRMNSTVHRVSHANLHASNLFGGIREKFSIYATYLKRWISPRPRRWHKIESYNPKKDVFYTYTYPHNWKKRFGISRGSNNRGQGVSNMKIFARNFVSWVKATCGQFFS